MAEFKMTLKPNLNDKGYNGKHMMFDVIVNEYVIAVIHCDHLDVDDINLRLYHDGKPISFHCVEIEDGEA